ncbi:hypothetical protein BDN70DRAFT_871882 [Pholiota conissans]|uniref:Carboxymuconolactone decarboxylase-like domain-containing protein n=1 Tax=Pholiota conissans TaxID=109636 RepID=A0A9P5ZB05_9AGAR|nr:hypothetical protein BDN70DRAFT_871882 [Pholiota conissans]
MGSTATAFRVSSSFLNGLRALFPENLSLRGSTNLSEHQALKNPWYIVAAVAFSASNRPEAVPQVFEHVLEEMKSSPCEEADSKLLAQKLREAIFKSGLISGYPKAINALKSLHETMPEHLKDTVIRRNPNASLSEYETNGQTLWRTFYGEQADSVQGLLDSIYPDMGWFSRTIGYGLVYGHTDIISSLETSYTLVAALIAGDTPQQIAWHLDSARRKGATLEEIRAVREVSVRVAEFSGIQWRHPIPEVEPVQS